MTNAKNTKRALLSSVIALILCFAMLLGTTYAWFTDSVVSNNNIIKSGTLDVEMYYADGAHAVPADNSTDWIDASTGAIFNYDRWEPGYVQVRHIKIANEGTLALKYKVNIVANGEVSDLADVIDVYYVDPAEQIADRTDLTADKRLGTLTEVLAALGTTGNGTLAAGAADTITIAFKMQETAGNEYQNKSIGTDFSVQILATQLASEFDGFDNNYDAEATYPTVSTVVIDNSTTVDTPISVGDAIITLPSGIDEGKYQATISNIEESVDANDNDIISFDLTLTKDGVKVEDDGTTLYHVSYYIGLNKNFSKVLHKGVPVAGATYDPATGYVNFTVEGFSPFQIITYTGEIETVYEFVDNFAKGGNFILANDIDLAGIDWTPVGTSDERFTGVLDGNGHTISGLTVNAEYAALIAYAGENVTIKNLALENVDIDSTKYGAGVVCMAGSGLTIENVTVSGTIDATSYASGLVVDADEITIKNCVNNATVNSQRAAGIGAWITNATVENVVNNGDITGTIGAAGIANRFSGNMKKATNNGDVTANGVEPAAGIAAIQSGISTYEYCVNNGAVISTADNPNASAAGILGQTPGTKATLNYCINTDDITAEQSYAAGIAYSLYGSVTANYCYNSGDVSGADGAGGITPKAQYGNGDKANYCVVDATVTSANGIAYAVCNNVTGSFYYADGQLYNQANTVVTAKDAMAILNNATGGIFFKVVEGRIVASTEYNWVGDMLVTDVATLQATLNNATDGCVITLGADITGDVIVSQKEGVNIVIYGQNYNYDGTIYVYGNSRNTGAETLTIKNINFVTTSNVDRDFIHSYGDNTKTEQRYAHNVTIENCTFTNDYDGTVVPARFRQAYNITIKNCTVEGTFSPLWTTGVQGLTIQNVTANCANEGMTIGASNNVLIEDCTITVPGENSFGIRTDATDGYKLTVNNCKLNVAKPIVIRGSSETYTVIVDGEKYVSTTEELINAIKNAPVGETTTIVMADGVYAGDIKITVAALGKSGGDVVIKPIKGANPVITGTVTLGYRNQGVGATMYDANVTFEGITFDHAAVAHSLDIQDVKSLTLKNCTIIGEGEYGIGCARGNATGTSKIIECTFENAGLQLLGNYATGLVIDDCDFNDSCVNVQAGNGVTVQNCRFNNTLTSAHIDGGFYAIRSNSTPITVKDCTINIDSELTEVVTGQAKWYLLANRGTTNWTVENVAITMSTEALMQTELDITACTSTGIINTTNLTVNGVAK